MNNFDLPDYVFSGFGSIECVSGAQRASILASVKSEGSRLASLIIGVKHDSANSERLDNLKFMLRWLDHHYGDLFDVLLMEQDSEPRIQLEALGAKPYVRYAFAYNPQEYNRGWGYNVAVRHHCQDAKVVALMDTDVLTGPNFLKDVIDCHSRIDVASPYLNIYYADPEDSLQVQQTMSLSHLIDPSRIKNPVTVAGGIVIWNRSAYMAIKGFEQYVGYGAEDRALDVAIFNHIEPTRVRISPATYVHMFHEIDTSAKRRTKDIFAHLYANYACAYDRSLTPYEFIHKNCKHVGRAQTTALMLARTRDFGDSELYRRGDALAVNGVRITPSPTVRIEDVTFPPDSKGLEDYTERETYPNTLEPDSDELAQFYNRFKGQRCFIIGNGPSLNRHDLSLLKNEYSFGVNSLYYKTQETRFRPTFYVVEDSSVMKENLMEICAYEAPFKFFPTIYRKLHPKTPNTFFFNMNRGFYEKTSPNYAVPRFSTDASHVLYCGQSVTYINLQLAYFMGFTEVYLIGMDFDYVIPESHKRTGDVLLSDTDDINHFHKDYFGKGKTWKDPKLDRVLLNYKMANLVFASVGRKIFNATKGGKLEEFQRVDYRSLFSCEAAGSAKLSKPRLDTATLDEAISLKKANELTRIGRFREALDMNKYLFKKTHLSIYEKNIDYLLKKMSRKT
uniref:6-hydroxymethylpterin diphosphokinase MptE-like protein n=1 Tax=Orrella sp. TaxID=1921583 RepID=UPI004048CA63